ncbi:MAG: hypothetical protein AABW67_00415 [Nanoarchaeota archaeon]|mgnify:CR=1 FL=1
MENEILNILNELKEIRVDINFIKNNMIDVDCVLTDKERDELKEARGEYERGETTSLEDFEKEMRLTHKNE